MTPQLQSARLRQLCALAPVIPVLVVSDPEQAEPLAIALIAGGLPVLEITLRTPCAPEVIRRMARLSGGLDGHIGAGTVLTPDDVKRAKDAGAHFAVAPGATDQLIRACEDAALPLLPGAATASEVMRAAEYGYDLLKFFPAVAAGGTAMLESLGGPLPGIQFCPTGGISVNNAADYLALSNVACVGGSWIAPDTDLRAADWPAIRARAAIAAQLGRG